MTSRRRVLSVVISVAVLGLLFWLVDLDRLVRVLSGVDPALAAGGGIVLLGSYLPVALRWQILHRATGETIGFRNATEIVTISYGANNLLPANTGDLARSKITSLYVPVESHAEVLGLVLVERIYDVIAIGALLWLSSLFMAPAYVERFQWILGALTVIVLVTVSLLRRNSLDRLLGLLPGRLESRASQTVYAYQSVTRRGAILAGVYTSARWLVAAGSLVIFGRALGEEVTPALAIFVICAMGLAATIPFSPGGIGPVEAVGTGLLTLSGITYEASLSLVVIHRSVGLVLLAVVALAVYNYRMVVASFP